MAINTLITGILYILYTKVNSSDGEVQHTYMLPVVKDPHKEKRLISLC